MIEEDEAREKIASGWFHAWLGFTAVAIKPEISSSALHELITKLDSDGRTKVFKVNYKDVIEIDNPLPEIPKGYSRAAEVEIIAKDFDGVLHVVMEYGPSAAELITPKKFEMKSSEAQNILNSISTLMHRFAGAGLGGFIFVRGK